MQILVAVIFALVGLVVWLARMGGRASARAKALKEEVQNYAKAEKIKQRVRAMDVVDVRCRLQERTK